MSESKLILEQKLEQEVRCYAIPEGNKAQVIALGGTVTECQHTGYICCHISSTLLNAAKRSELGIRRIRLPRPSPEFLARIQSDFTLATLEKDTTSSEGYLLTAPLEIFPAIEHLASTPLSLLYKLKSKKAPSLSVSCPLPERAILEEANLYVKKNLRYGAANKGNHEQILKKLAPFFNETTKQHGIASFSKKKESVVSALIPQLKASKLLLNFDPEEAGERNLVKASISIGLMQLFFSNEIQEGISPHLGLLFGAGNCGVQIQIALNFLLEHYREQLKYPILGFLLYKKGYTKTPEKMFDPEQGHALLVFGNFHTETDRRKKFWCLDPWNDENPIYDTDGWPEKFPGSLKTQWSSEISEYEVLFEKAPDTFNAECPQYGITALEIDELIEKVYKVLVENQNYAPKGVRKKKS